MRYIVSALESRNIVGKKSERFSTSSAAEVYGMNHFGINNYKVVPESEVKWQKNCVR